jgi:hypothetical protein
MFQPMISSSCLEVRSIGASWQRRRIHGTKQLLHPLINPQVLATLEDETGCVGQ